MKFSKSFIFTSKETPSDATLVSHKLLLRAGYIHNISSGLYNLLPLGKRVLDKITNIVKEELDRAGALEVELAFVTPIELWKESGRERKFGKELLRFQDRKGNGYVLGPTHEEMIVSLFGSYVNSYKQLPKNLYQIKTKFRDEARPRFGLMRAREFVMKDGYSFHATEEDMKREFQLMEETYKRIFERLGLDFRVVEADSGAIGGSGSKEFMVIADSGEDQIVLCSSCDYSANIETAKRKRLTPPDDEVEMDFAKFKTPDVRTIDELSNFFHISPYFIAKSVVKKAIFEDGEKIVVFFLRGVDELEETKAKNSINAIDLVDATSEEISDAGLVAGYIGFHELTDRVLAVFDIELQDGVFITGANEKDYHYIGAKPNNGALYRDIAKVREGDCCPVCGEKVLYKRGIEVGHIFQLGTKYTEALGVNFLDQNGKSKPVVMGTYGIGISRLIAAIVEQHHDEKGIIFPKQVAPYTVNILISNIKNKKQVEIGEALYNKLIDAGVDVILDDRKERFGFKIRDAELLGFPFTIIVGNNVENGEVELMDRKRNFKESLNIDSVFDKVMKLI